MQSIPPATSRKADLIEGFITGLAVITAFSDERPLLTASELAAALDISRAAARRFLITLHHTGYAATDGRSYWLTPKVLALGHSYLGSARLPRTVQPFLQSMSLTVQESSNLALLEAGDIVYVARANVPRLMNTPIEPGTRLPAHTTAAGRIILAQLPKAEVEAWLADHPLTAYTPHTVKSREAFLAEIEAARESGYCAVESQYEMGLRGIAVPLIRRGGGVVGALGVSMASSSCELEEARERCVPPLQEAARQLAGLL